MESGWKSDQVISFGPYRVDRAGGRLLRGGTNVPLRRKTFTVLEYLAARPGRLVSKDELLDAVWPATHVTPCVLAGCIREVRRALGDDARAPRFIETAHRRGYRFIGSAVLSSASVEAPGTAPASVLGEDGELAELARRFAQAVTHLVQRRRGRASHPRATHRVTRWRAAHWDRRKGQGKKTR
ncbi:MAG TPA: winged helix-turn-helix domain-containing protein [Candidatus Binatus sp.]|nr:winged helix-turn-helix domain-containing protein [Candidatus Binatus sp.]